MAGNIVVTYKAFVSVMDMEAELGTGIFNQLRRLSYGNSGCMWPTLAAHRNGYVEQTEFASAWYNPTGLDEFELNLKALDHKYNIIIAFNDDKPVGWVITDDDDKFNIYVAKGWRKSGVSRKLTELWLKMCLAQKRFRIRGRPHIWDFVHTDDARNLIIHAANTLGIWTNKKKGGPKKVTRHVVPNL